MDADIIFFFSSRRRHTRLQGDWSSDVCSSDLFNSGWVQIMGPASRVADFKAIETSPAFFGLQQIRWPPTNIADTPEQARAQIGRASCRERGENQGVSIAGNEK